MYVEHTKFRDVRVGELWELRRRRTVYLDPEQNMFSSETSTFTYFPETRSFDEGTVCLIVCVEVGNRPFNRGRLKISMMFGEELCSELFEYKQVFFDDFKEVTPK